MSSNITVVEFDKMPESGTLYVLLRDRIIYKKYNIKGVLICADDYNKYINNLDMLELHAFNKEKEYRILKVRNRESTTGYTYKSFVITDENEEYADKYEEHVFIKDEFCKGNESNVINVVNYISYDDNNLLRINSYRFAEV